MTLGQWYLTRGCFASGVASGVLALLFGLVLQTHIACVASKPLARCLWSRGGYMTKPSRNVDDLRDDVPQTFYISSTITHFFHNPQLETPPDPLNLNMPPLLNCPLFADCFDEYVIVTKCVDCFR